MTRRFGGVVFFVLFIIQSVYVMFVYRHHIWTALVQVRVRAVTILFVDPSSVPSWPRGYCLCLDQVDHGHRGDRLGERQPLPLLRQPSPTLARKDEIAVALIVHTVDINNA